MQWPAALGRKVKKMDMFWAGFFSGAGAAAVLGMLCRQVLHAAAERRFREAYIATLTPQARERLLSFEAGGSNWRQFRDRQSAA
jgi:hypothetical protein